jgi:hypothetical protein
MWYLLKYVWHDPLNSLQGGAATLYDKRLLAVIMETNGTGIRYGGSDDELIGVMRGHGFAPFGYDPFERRLVDVMDASGNTVFVRDKAAVAALVKAAPKYKLVNGEI